MSIYMNSPKIKSNLILFYEVTILGQSPLKPVCGLYFHMKQNKLGYLQEVQQKNNTVCPCCYKKCYVGGWVIIRQLTEDFRKWENALCCFIGSDTQKTFQEYHELLKLSTGSSLLLGSFSLVSKPRCSSRMFWVHVYGFREQWMATQTEFLRSISARWTINKKDPEWY